MAAVAPSSSEPHILAPEGFDPGMTANCIQLVQYTRFGTCTCLLSRPVVFLRTRIVFLSDESSMYLLFSGNDDSLRLGHPDDSGPRNQTCLEAPLVLFQAAVLVCPLRDSAPILVSLFSLDFSPGRR